MKAILLRMIQRFPKGSIQQTRYVCLPLVGLSTAFAFRESQLGLAERVGWFALGIAAWSFLEYVLHRYVLHYLPRTVLGKALLDRLHILHHQNPLDQTQVCIPLLLSAPLWVGVFGLFVLFGGNHSGSLLVTCGIALMMVVYDSVHFSTHYEKPKTKWMARLKKHHMLHHFSNDTKRFGVTSPMWDYVFGTNK